MKIFFKYKLLECEKIKAIFILLLFWLLIGKVSAQQSTDLTMASGGLPSLSICGSIQTFSATITNITGSPINGATFTTKLPTGVRYIAGSFTGVGVSLNTAFTNDSIRFNLPSLAGGASLTLTFDAQADCSSTALLPINIYNNYYTNWGTFFNKFKTANYPILSPSVSLSLQNNAIYNGAVGTTFTRRVRITNGGNGHLTQVLFRDINGNGISISSVSIGSLVVSGDTNTIILNSAVISAGASGAAGDGDAFLEVNEYIDIDETVLITSCTNTLSALYASWGCNAVACATATASANVVIPSTFPILNITTPGTFNPDYANRCFGAGDSRNYTIRVSNTGTGRARNIALESSLCYYPSHPSYMPEAFYSRIDTASIMVQYSGKAAYHKSLSSVTALTNTSIINAFGVGNIFGAFTLNLDTLSGGNFVLITFSVLDACAVSSGCGGVLYSGWATSATYQNECQNTSYSNIREDGKGGSYNGLSIYSLVPEVPKDVSNGQTYKFCLTNLRGVNIGSVGGVNRAYTEWQLTLPAGLTWDGNIANVKWISANGTQTWLASKVTLSGNTLKMRWNNGAYPGGFGSFDGSDVCFSLSAVCGTNGNLNIPYELAVVSDSTCISICRTRVFCGSDLNTLLHCGVSCTTGGMYNKNFTLQRVSYGKPDNNDDGLADATGSLDFAKIKTNRAMYGDTMRAIFTGVVEIASIPSFSKGYALLNLNNYKYQALTAKIHIRDVSTGIAYNLTNIPVSNVTVRQLKVEYSPAYLSTYGLPNTYAFEHGDSVIISLDFRNDENILNQNLTVSATTEFYLANVTNPTLAADKYACDYFSSSFTLYGYYEFECCSASTRTPNSCGEVSIGGHFYLSMGACCSNYGGGNAFPYEYRAWSRLKKYRVIIPKDYTFKRGALSYGRTAGTNNAIGYWFDNLMPASTDGDTLTFNLEPLFQGFGGTTPISDDGYHGAMYIYLSPNCSVPNGVDRTIAWQPIFQDEPIIGGRTIYYQNTTTGSLPKTYFADASTLKYAAPNIKISTATPIVNTNVNPLTIDVMVNNLSGVSTADSVWLSTQYLNAASITQVQTLPALTNLTASNGIYKLGTFAAGSSRSYRLTLQFSSCKKDTFYAVTGWNCASYPSSYAAAKCVKDSVRIEITPNTASLQVIGKNYQPLLDLCQRDTLEFDVSNSQTSNALNLALYSKIPAGMSYVTGSTQLLYPSSGSYISVGNPTNSATKFGWLEWNINAAFHATLGGTGLTGVSSAPNNRFKLRFIVETDCNYISGSAIDLAVTANSPCGDPLSASIALPGPLNINGATPPYLTLVQVSMPNRLSVNIAGGSKVSVKVRNLSSTVTGAVDHFYLYFPLGSTYQGSFMGFRNSPFTSTPVSTTVSGQTRFDWTIPSGIVMGDSMFFECKISLPNNFQCGSLSVTAQAAVATGNVSCGASTCVLSAQSGGQIVNTPVVIESFLNKSDVTTCRGDATNAAALITSSSAFINPIWKIGSASGTTISAPSSVAPAATTQYYLIAESATNTNCLDTAFTELTIRKLTVNNTNDSGEGSLRQAMQCANSWAAFDTIIFNIPATDINFQNPDGIANNGDEYWNIALAISDLPTVTDDLVIDGLTQTGTDCNLNIISSELNLHPIYPNNKGGKPRGIKLIANGGATPNQQVILNSSANSLIIRGLSFVNWVDATTDGTGAIILNPLTGASSIILDCSFMSSKL